MDNSGACLKIGGSARKVFYPGPCWAKVFLPFRVVFSLLWSGCGDSRPGGLPLKWGGVVTPHPIMLVWANWPVSVSP